MFWRFLRFFFWFFPFWKIEKRKEKKKFWICNGIFWNVPRIKLFIEWKKRTTFAVRRLAVINHVGEVSSSLITCEEGFSASYLGKQKPDLRQVKQQQKKKSSRRSRKTSADHQKTACGLKSKFRKVTSVDYRFYLSWKENSTNKRKKKEICFWELMVLKFN